MTIYTVYIRYSKNKKQSFSMFRLIFFEKCLYIYIYIYIIYIYKHFSKKISRNIENDYFLFFEYLTYTVYIVMVLSYTYYIYKTKS